MNNYIKEQIKNTTHFSFAGIEVFIKDPLPGDVSFKETLEELESILPRPFLKNIDSIYVGQFEKLHDRNLQAMYIDSSIFVSNQQSSTDDILSDLIHEIAHSVEEEYGSFIYSDGTIESEFLIKRKKLWQKLRDLDFKIDLNYFLETEYSQKFDEFLYKKVGYPTMAATAANLFFSPYGATSLREYFANGFEGIFFDEDPHRLQKISPKLFSKIESLINIVEEEY